MTAQRQGSTTMPACRRCHHYFITHDPSRPYGCRALGFKSRYNPAMVVLSTSGIPCQLFRVKDRKPGSNGRTSKR